MNYVRNIIILLMLSFAMSVFCQAGVTVNLRETARVAGDYVQLLAVADVNGDKAGQKRVAGLYLGPVPPVGKTRRITRAQIHNRLFEVGLARMVRLVGSDAVMVSRGKGSSIKLLPAANSDLKSQQINNLKENDYNKKLFEHMAGQAIRRYLENSMQRDDLEIKILAQNSTGKINLQITSMNVQRIITGRLPGRARVRLIGLEKSGKICGKFDVRVEVQVFAQVLFLRRPLQRGQVLQSEDLMIRKIEIKNNVAYLPMNPKALVGKQAAKYLRVMTPLKQGDLKIPAAVIKGQPITIKTFVGGFTVSLRAKSLGEARPGELVEVENLDTKKHFMAQVTGFGTARMPKGNRR